MKLATTIAALALCACGSDKGKEEAVAVAAIDADPGVAMCERFNAGLQRCQEQIVAAVRADPKATFTDAQLAGLRTRLAAPPSCVGAKADKASKTAACLSDDCEQMASCMAAVLAPRPSGPTVVARPDAFTGNVLFVLVDTVRADRLGVAGYRRNGASLTPRLDTFAATATRFTRAYAQGANTPRSLPSMWSSRYPSQIPFAKSFLDFPPVLDDAELLFESLAAGGLFTTGFSSHFYFVQRRNVAQGFAEYDNAGALSIAGSNKDVAAPRIVPKAIARLEALAAKQRRFAMFVHLFEPHSTYVTYDEYPVKEKKTAGLEEKYDYEIAVADRFVGELLDALDRLALTERTMVVILSDHGEAFGVHKAEGERLFFHGMSLYDEILRVPVLIRVPGLAPSVRDDVVGLIDVAPTILDVLGQPAPAAFVGRSLAPLLRGETLPPRPVGAVMSLTPAWKHEAQALVSGDGKDKIIAHGDGRLEVFDLVADPEERTDLSRSDAARTARLKAELEAWSVGLTR